MARKRDDTAYNELELLRKQHHGSLKARDVVAAAASETSPLHKYFDWDDSTAASKYRLWQARELIKYVVVVVPDYHKPINAYVSLKEDRLLDGGTYRSTVDVLSNERRRNLLLAQALADLKVWEDKYNELTELAPIFETAEKVRAQRRQKTVTQQKKVVQKPTVQKRQLVHA